MKLSYFINEGSKKINVGDSGFIESIYIKGKKKCKVVRLTPKTVFVKTEDGDISGFRIDKMRRLISEPMYQVYEKLYINGVNY